MTGEGLKDAPLLAPRPLTPEQLASDKLFRELATPLDPQHFPDIRDAQLYVRRDGLIVNAEGWFHPPGKLVGEAMYAPDARGSKMIFGHRFSKLTLFPGTHDPIPYAQRSALLRAYDPSLDQVATNPYFARYKQFFDRRDFIAFLSGETVFRKLMPRLISRDDPVVGDISDIDRIIDFDLKSVTKGFTGAPSFGQLDQLHDLDLIFSGDLTQNLGIAKAIRDTVRRDTDRRLQEGGKGWNIRFLNDRGTLICCFFTYKRPEDAPLRDFTMEVIEPNVVIEAQVADDAHAMYTPTVLDLEKVRLLRINDKKTNTAVDQPMQLITYHTASRGECFIGDQITARGALVYVTTPTSQRLGLCAIDREAVRNLTPTWEGYYDDGGTTV